MTQPLNQMHGYMTKSQSLYMPFCSKLRPAMRLLVMTRARTPRSALVTLLHAASVGLKPRRRIQFSLA